ncbi:hypothetical protein ACFL1L_01860 [Thermoplasmatota archaeon]
MKDKILQDIKKWYENQKENPDISDFVDLVINKTTNSIFDTVKKELENEFTIGNLEHPFIISSEYYLELKLKEIKKKFIDNYYQNKLDYKKDEEEDGSF